MRCKLWWGKIDTAFFVCSLHLTMLWRAIESSVLMAHFYYIVHKDDMSTEPFHAKQVLSPNRVMHSYCRQTKPDRPGLPHRAASRYSHKAIWNSHVFFLLKTRIPMLLSHSGDKTWEYSIFSMFVLHNLQVHFTLCSYQKKQKLRITYVIRNFCLIWCPVGDSNPV